MQTGEAAPALTMKTQSRSEIKAAAERIPARSCLKKSDRCFWANCLKQILSPGYLILMLLRNLLASVSEQFVFWSQRTIPCQTRLP